MIRQGLVRCFAVAAIVAFLTQFAHASILGSVLTNGLNTINDVNRERIIKGALSVDDPLTPGDESNTGNPLLVEFGDTLETVLLMDNISNANGTFLVTDVPGLPGLTVYSRITVTSKTPDSNPGEFNFVFGSGFGDGVTVAEVYEASSLNDVGMFDSLVPNVANNIADATDGTFLLSLVLGGAPDFWTARGTDNLTLVSTADPVNYRFGLTVGVNPAGIPIVPDGVSSLAGLHDVRGSGQVFNLADPALGGGWQAASNTQVEFRAIPEPASFLVWAGLMGCTLAGLRFSRNRFDSRNVN